MLLSEMLGVERDTEFMVKGHSRTFKIRENSLYGHESIYTEMSSGVWVELYDAPTIMEMIATGPDCIIHLPPPMTDEQREQLKAIWTLGGRWLAKDFDCAVNYFKTKPYKESGNWFARDDGEVYGYPVPLSASVRGLQELNRVDEPYDIGKALGVGE